MEANKPYLWLGKDQYGNLSLDIKVSDKTDFNNLTYDTVDHDCLEVSYKLNANGVKSKSYTPVTISQIGYNPATHNRIRVLIKDSLGTTLGSCTRDKTYLTNNTPTTVKPFVWLSSSKIYVDVDTNTQIHLIPVSPPLSYDYGSLRTLPCDQNPVTSTNSTGWSSTATDFDPAVISKIKIQIGAVGETTSNTDDADGSGDNDLLDDFFD